MSITLSSRHPSIISSILSNYSSTVAPSSHTSYDSTVISCNSLPMSTFANKNVFAHPVYSIVLSYPPLITPILYFAPIKLNPSDDDFDPTPIPIIAKLIRRANHELVKNTDIWHVTQKPV